MISPIVLPDIDPVAIQLGPIAVRWYGLMYLAGFLFAMWVANREADKPDNNWSRADVSDLLFYGFLGVILGGRIGYVMFYQFEMFLADPIYLVKIWMGGMSFHGGLIGVVIAIAWFARKKQKRILEVGDFVAPIVPFGLGAGRLGNFINGELWGRVSDVPWAIVFPTGGPLPRHPSQLYEFFLEGIVLYILLAVFSRFKPPQGALSGLFLLGYGTFRFIIEFFRQPDEHLGLLTLNMSMGQMLSLPMMIIGALFIGRAYHKQRVEKQA